jgi:hypothetical protein
VSNQGWQETIIEAQSDGTAVTAAAETTLLPAHAVATLPPNYFSRPGKRIRIRASGKISSVITTPGTARFKVKLGSVAVFDSLAILLDSVAAHTDVGWKLEIELTQRAVGTAATLMGIGTWTCEDILGVPAAAPKGCLTAILPWNSAPAAGTSFDATVSEVLDLTFTQTAATGSITLQQYAVESLN